MIRIYTQYSFGGYKIFPIEGISKEQLDKEVTEKQSFGYPSEAEVFFNYGGARIAYKQLSNGELMLVVRELPSSHTDSSGRYIPCAVQFIGDKSDRELLDNLTIRITSNLREFSLMFQTLFYDRGSLYVKGDVLRSYIQDCEGSLSTSHELPISIRSIYGNTSQILLFVPTSNLFGSDKTVTNRTLEELRLGSYETFASQILSCDKFNDLQKECIQLHFEKKLDSEAKYSATEQTVENKNEQVENPQPQQIKSNSASIGNLPQEETIEMQEKSIQDLAKELAKEKDCVEHLRLEISKLKSEREDINKEKAELHLQIQKGKKIILGLMLLSLVSLVGWCNSGNDDKEVPSIEQAAIPTQEDITDNIPN